MKTQTLSALVLAPLLAATAALPLQAAEYYKTYPHQSMSSPPRVAEWRLGNGGRHGHEIYYRTRDDRRWTLAPGEAIAVGDGWVIGTDHVNGGYGIYRWNGFGWQRMPGAGVEIGGTYEFPWVVNDRGERFNWTGFEWRNDFVYNERHRNDHWREHDDDRRRDERRDRDDDHHRNDWRDRDHDHDHDRD